MSTNSPRIDRMRVPVYEDQRRLVLEAIDGRELVFGRHLEQLERRLCELSGRRFAVLTANGFAALVGALRAVTQPGEAVLTAAASTCFSMVHAIRAAGGVPSYCDLEVKSCGFDRVPPSFYGRVVVAPDHFGCRAPICRREPDSELVLIEDAAQAFLTLVERGSFAQVVVLSLYPTKSMNGIDGGAILTDDEDVFGRARDAVSYVQQTTWDSMARLNLKLNNVNAAFALGTLEHLDETIKRSRQIRDRLGAALADRAIPYVHGDGGDLVSRFVLTAPSAADRTRWESKLRAMDIETARELLFVCPPELESRFPGAQHLVASSFSIPSHAELTDAEVARIVAAIGQLP